MKHHRGRIEVICGSMFSGKSEELIRRIRRAEIAKQKVQIFKPSLDDRYGVDSVNSHDGRQIEAVAVESPSAILDNLEDTTTVVAIDEAQFFGETLVNVCRSLAEERDIRVILAGLDMDFRGEPFVPMPALIAQAEQIDKLHAICIRCGEEATRSQRLVNGNPARYDDPIIMVGAQDLMKHAAAIATQCRAAPNEEIVYTKMH